MKNNKRIRKMKKNKTILVLALCLFVGYNVYQANKDMSAFDLVLTNIDSSANDGESWGCAGNPTFIPNQALLNANCWNGGTHLKCKDYKNVCCDPSKQTDCSGIL